MESSDTSKTLPFDPKKRLSVESFVIERFTQIKELDQAVSKVLLCNSIAYLLPIMYQKHLASSRITCLADMLNTVRKLEFIFDANDLRKSSAEGSYGNRGKNEVKGHQPTYNVHEVHQGNLS